MLEKLGVDPVVGVEGARLERKEGRKERSVTRTPITRTFSLNLHCPASGLVGPRETSVLGLRHPWSSSWGQGTDSPAYVVMA